MSVSYMNAVLNTFVNNFAIQELEYDDNPIYFSTLSK